MFADDLRLHESKTTDFRSLHEVFIRELKDGARPIDPDPEVVVSPCDAIVGEHGRINGTECIQAKGFPYTLLDLLGDQALVERHRDGQFITLRLQANMYHRFHAPVGGRVRNVTYISGDTWNVNPVALKRVEKLFCKNERAIVDIAPPWPGSAVTMVPVAAILVAGIRFTFVDTPLTLQHKGTARFPCDTRFEKGAELGRFESGSTIILFTTGSFEFVPGLIPGTIIRVGQPLMRHTPNPKPSS
jgi:phosphatidylserine decarboxylase